MYLRLGNFYNNLSVFICVTVFPKEMDCGKILRGVTA
jgi:hypothetical protein